MPLDILNRQRKVKLDMAALRPRFAAALEAAEVAHKDVTLVLVSDKAIHALNKEWRGIDAPTDCLSFPAAEGEGGEFAGEVLGDIVISLERAREQGPIHVEADVPADQALSSEVVFLFVHSLLHLLGHDHDKPAQAKKMQAEEKRILAAIA